MNSDGPISLSCLVFNQICSQQIIVIIIIMFVIVVWKSVRRIESISRIHSTQVHNNVLNALILIGLKNFNCF